MNEITRIHIAKVAYDVEVAAKKQLEKYLKSLEAYAGDKEVFDDVEVRITELLGERGVQAGGVISTDDVKAIREQLGEPYEFAGEDGDIAVGSNGIGEGKKFFRSTDNAVLGGVLSGIAAYLGVNAVWVRIAFIILTLISFGLALFAYIILWILVPPARTAADKLQQAGQPVTIESIRELNEAEAHTKPNSVAPILRRTITFSLGLASLLGAVSIVAITLTGIFRLSVNDFTTLVGLPDESGAMTATAWVVLSLIIIGFMLLASLFAVASYAFFTEKFTKRMLVSCVVIIALGITACTVTVGVAGTQAWRMSSEIQSLVKDTEVSLPSEFSKVKTLTIEQVTSKHAVDSLGYASIEYVVSDEAPHYELRGIPGTKPVITLNGESATVQLAMPNDYRTTFAETTLVIYGPALSQITNHASVAGYNTESQDALEIITKDNSSLSINSGKIATVTVKGSGSAEVGLASVTSLVVEAEQGLMVSAGTIRDLTVAMPDVCPAGSTATSSVNVSEVTSGRVTYNGEERDAKTYRTSCSEVVIDEDSYTIMN